MGEPNDASTETAMAADKLQRCIDVYIDAWNEPEPSRRARLLSQAMTHDAGYADPVEHLDSRAGIVEYIGGVLGKYPGGQIVRTSELDVHHLFGRFTWRLVQSDGTPLADSVDFVEFAGDGKIRRVTGFFGLQMPNDSSDDL